MFRSRQHDAGSDPGTEHKHAEQQLPLGAEHPHDPPEIDRVGIRLALGRRHDQKIAGRRRVEIRACAWTVLHASQGTKSAEMCSS